jgi:hypothetical protein
MFRGWSREEKPRHGRGPLIAVQCKSYITNSVFGGTMSSTLCRFAFASILSLTLTGVLIAQEKPQTPPPRPDQTTPQRSTQDEMTLAGCLKQGKDSGQATASADDFFLTNAVPAGAASTSGSGKPGTATTATGTPPPTTAGGTRPSEAARAGGATGGMGKTYRITGLDKAQLSKHINHQVEIEGRVSATGGAASSTPSATRPEAAAGAAAGDAPGVIQATAVKMISATCAPKE